MAIKSSAVQNSWMKRKRNITGIVATLVVISFLATPFADTFVSSGSDTTVNGVTVNHVIYEKNMDGTDTAMVDGCDLAELGNIVIESTVTIDGESLPVVSILTAAFSDNEYITSITIPDTIVNIDDRAFEGCSSNAEFITPSAGGAFQAVDGVLFNSTFTVLIQYPAAKNASIYNVPDTTKTINGRAFAGCTNLTDVTIPSTINLIGYGPFVGCTSLKSIRIQGDEGDYYTDDGILFYKDDINVLFTYPAAKEGHMYEVPDDVIMIMPFAFSESQFLQSIDLNNVVSINESAFLRSSLTSIEIPGSVTLIQWGAFKDCESMKCITFDTGCKGIESNAFIGFTFYDSQGPPISDDQYNEELPNHTFTGDSISQMNGTEEGKLFNVFFDVDGGSKKVEPQNIVKDGNITLPQYDGTKDGLDFAGWSYNGTTYQPGKVIKKEMGGCVTIKAVWVPQPNVIFDEAGGSIHLNPIYVEDGKQFTLPEYKGTKDGFEFAGWSYNGVTYQPGKVLTKDVSGTVKITAVWTPIEEPVSGSSGFDFLPVFFAVIVALIVVGCLIFIIYDDKQ